MHTNLNFHQENEKAQSHSQRVNLWENLQKLTLSYRRYPFAASARRGTRTLPRSAGSAALFTCAPSARTYASRSRGATKV